MTNPEIDLDRLFRRQYTVFEENGAKYEDIGIDDETGTGRIDQTKPVVMRPLGPTEPKLMSGRKTRFYIVDTKSL